MGAEYPYPPRMMVKQRAAAYLDISVAEFEREVARGRLPMSIRLGNREHWSRVAIDEAVERLAGERGDDWKANQPFFQNVA